MGLIERCSHQFHSPARKECGTCAYDPVNNKICPGYVPIVYEMPDKKLELASFESSNQNLVSLTLQNCEDIRA